MQSASVSLRWALFLFVIVLGGALLVLSHGVEAAPDGVQLWNEDFTRKASAARDGGIIGISATDLVTSGGTNSATVSDPANPSDSIQVTLFDDGTNGDTTANDGLFIGRFTVVDDNGTTGSRTNESSGRIDIAEGDRVSVHVDLDGDGSYSEVTIGTDYHGPGMTIPFEGGFVSGRIIITVTIIVEGEAEIDPTSITYSLDFGPAVPFDQIAPLTWRAIIDTYNLTDGPHTVTTNAGDVAGNLESSTIDFIADNTVPDIFHVGTRIAPSGDVLIDTSVRDLYLDCRTVRWRWDEGVWQAPVLDQNISAVSCFTMTIPFDDMVPGEHSIEVNARDLANNSMTRITTFTLPEPQLGVLVIEVNDSRPFEPVACSTMTIPVDLTNPGPVPIDLTADLMMDDRRMDSRDIRLFGMSCETLTLDLPDLTYGEHDVEIVFTAFDAPFLWLPVFTGEDGTFFVDVPDISIGDDNASYFPVDLSLVRPGQEFIIDGTIRHSELLDDQNCTVELTMDEETAEFLRTHVNLTGNESTFRITVPTVTEGTHDVGLSLYLPGMVSPDEPVRTLPVRGLDGDPFSVAPVRLFFDTNTSPLRVNINDLRPGDTFTVKPWVGTHEWEGVYDVWVDLVVDGEVVDRVRNTIRGNTSGKEFELRWDNITHGLHKVELRLYSDDHEDGFIPIETREVRDPDGRTLVFSPVRLEMDDLSGRLPEVSSFYRPGDDLHVHTTVFSYDRPGEYDFTVQLVVDGEVVDTFDGTHLGNFTNVPVDLTWENMTLGEHNLTLRLVAPELYGTDEPWQEIFVKDAQGRELTIDPVDMDLMDDNQFRVDTEGVRPGDDLVVTGGVINWERPGEYPYTIQLVVDGRVVDTVTGVGHGNATADRHEFTWRNVTPGEHDVKLILLAPDGSGVLKPIDTRDITDTEDGRVYIEPPRLSLGDGEGPLRVPASRLLPGDTLVVDVPVTCEEEEGLFDFTLHLTVDDLVVDEADGTFDAFVDVTRSVPLRWTEVTEGEHQVRVLLWVDDANVSAEPYLVLEVLDENGGPITVPGPDAVGDPDDRESTTEAPLPFLQPVYDIFPLEYFPEQSRPWVIPALVVVTAIGAAGALRGRRPRGSKGPGGTGAEGLDDGPETPLEGGEESLHRSGPYPGPEDPQDANPGWHTTLPGSTGEGGDLGGGGGPDGGSGTPAEEGSTGDAEAGFVRSDSTFRQSRPLLDVPDPSRLPEPEFGHVVEEAHVRGEGGGPARVGDPDPED